METSIRELSERARTNLELSFVNPTDEPGWARLVAASCESTAFHTKAWAETLMKSYQHTPTYLVVRDQAGIRSGWPVMEVNSPISGRRGVSLPFTDACAPILGNVGDRALMVDRLLEEGRLRRWKHLEFRDGTPPHSSASPSISFYTHNLDLRPGEERLFAGLDGSLRRGIRKAEKLGVTTTVETSEEALQAYYQLHCVTRKKHGLPPQPWSFFRNIAQEVLRKGHGFVVLASLDSTFVGGAVFLIQQTNGIYKFGASDVSQLQARPNNLVIWSGIRHLLDLGAANLNFGRTSLENAGLRRFKLNWGCSEEVQSYYRYDYKAGSYVTLQDRAHGWHNHFFQKMPLAVSRLLGRLMYPHLA